MKRRLDCFGLSKITKCHFDIKYTSEKSLQQFADELSAARRARDLETAYGLIALTMILFGNTVVCSQSISE